MLNIVRYATGTNIVGGFTKLLSYAAKTFNPDSFTATADHCEAHAELYEKSGFIVEKVLPPDYMYVVRNERKPRSEYPLERFHSDPKLLWEEGLTEMELADLNGLDRIWDADKLTTDYKRYLGIKENILDKKDHNRLEEEWHPTKNLPLTFSLSLRSNSKYWWLGKCGHEWEAKFAN